MDAGPDALREVFARHFEGWGVTLPQEDVRARRAGYLRQSGGSGSIRYVFGADERGEYLEYYAFQRIWGDGHARIYLDGEVEHLDTLNGMFFVVQDDPEATERNRRESAERNQRLLEQLDEAGLLAGGPVPNSFTINAALITADPQEPGPGEPASGEPASGGPAS